MTPLISVIVTCFNQEKTLEKAVLSVLNQTFTYLECLIIDDGSSDNSGSVAQKLISQDSRVQYFFKENGGVSSSRNFGVEKAQGNWIQFLDGDDWLTSDKIQNQLSHLNCLNFSSDQPVILYCDYQKISVDQNYQITQIQPQIVGELNSQDLIKRLLVPDFLAGTPFPLLQQCLLIHKSVFQYKKFDESLTILEDRDFVLNLLTQNIPFIYTPILGCSYVKYQSQQTLTSNWEKVKNAYLCYYETIDKKHPDLIPDAQIGIQHFISEAIREQKNITFNRLYSLVHPPVYLFEGKLKLTHRILLKFVYAFRKIILKLYSA